MNGPTPAPVARADAIDFVLELGRTLHEHGASAPEVENTLALLSRRLGLRGEFFATPTSLFASFGAEGDTSASASTTHLVRVVPSPADLARRARIDEIVRDVIAGRLSPAEARVLLAALRSDPPPYPAVLALAASALVSACAARIFGLELFEILLAGGVGLVVELLTLVAAGSPRVKRVMLPAAACVAGALVSLACGLAGEPTSLQSVVAGLITLLPGLRLTTAMRELALDHLAAGTARFLGSGVTLVTLLFGAALGAQLGRFFPETVPLAEIERARAAVPEWTLWLALATAPACFGVLFRALPRDLGWITLSCALAWLGSTFGERFLGGGLEAALGGLLVGVASNVYARVLDRPSVTTMLPGILLLVPGSIGFRSLFNLLEKDVISGVDAAFRVGIVGISIVAGLLVANVVVRPRKLDRMTD